MYSQKKSEFIFLLPGLQIFSSKMDIYFLWAYMMTSIFQQELCDMQVRLGSALFGWLGQLTNNSYSRVTGLCANHSRSFGSILPFYISCSLLVHAAHVCSVVNQALTFDSRPCVRAARRSFQTVSWWGSMARPGTRSAFSALRASNRSPTPATSETQSRTARATTNSKNASLYPWTWPLWAQSASGSK